MQAAGSDDLHTEQTNATGGSCTAVSFYLVFRLLFFAAGHYCNPSCYTLEGYFLVLIKMASWSPVGIKN